MVKNVQEAIINVLDDKLDDDIMNKLASMSSFVTAINIISLILIEKRLESQLKEQLSDNIKVTFMYRSSSVVIESNTNEDYLKTLFRGIQGHYKFDLMLKEEVILNFMEWCKRKDKIDPDLTIKAVSRFKETIIENIRKEEKECI